MMGGIGFWVGFNDRGFLKILTGGHEATGVPLLQKVPQNLGF